MKNRNFHNNCNPVVDYFYSSRFKATLQMGWQIDLYGAAKQLFIITRLITVTLVLFISYLAVSSQPAVAAGCGAEGQRGCKITFKRLKTCNKGLHINLKTKRCVRNKGILKKPPKLSMPRLPAPENPVQPSCGKVGQPGCKLSFKRLKACDKGLHLSLKTRRCTDNRNIARNPPKINLPKLPAAKPEHPRCGQRGYPGCKLKLGRVKACDKGLHLSLKTLRCVENRALAIKPPKINLPELPKAKPEHPRCGQLGYPGCKLNIRRIKACNKGLKLSIKTGLCTESAIANAVASMQKPSHCGKLNQVPCPLTPIRIRGCDLGFKENRDTGLCTYGDVFSAPQINCGSLNQVPCKITATRPKACDFGFRRNSSKTKCIEGGLTLRPVGNDCGAEDQRACKKWEAAFACRKELRRDSQSGLCIRKPNVDWSDKKALKRAAAEIKKESSTAIRTMLAAIRCISGNKMLLAATSFEDMQDRIELMKRAVKNRDIGVGIAIGASTCITPVLQEAEAGGYETVTLGLTVGGGAGIGGFIDQGFAFHVPGMLAFINDPERNRFPVPTYYQTKSASAGWQLGASTGISIGLFKDAATTANLRGSDTHGVTSELVGAVGAGVGVWFKYDGRLDGVSAAGVVGAEGSAAVYNRANTTIVSLSAPNTNVADCGAPGQRACKVWERLPVCDNGATFNSTTDTCNAHAPTVVTTSMPAELVGNGLDCGAVGERVCRVHEQVPGCNAGLRIDFQLKICAH